MSDGSTSVENMSYEGIYYSFIQAKGQELCSKGQALKDAKTEIESIGNELKGHVGRTEWKGQGGDAFREWGDAFAKQIIKLAHVAGTTGEHMVSAGNDVQDAVRQISDTPPEAVGQCYADADKEKDRLKTVEAKREKVMPHVRRAASTCQAAATTIKGLEVPEFRPMPVQTGVKDGGLEWGEPYGPSGGGSGGGPASQSSYGPGAGGAGSAGGSNSVPHTPGAAYPDPSGTQVPPPVHGDSGTGPVHVPAHGHDGSDSSQGNGSTRIDSGPSVPTVPTPTPTPTIPSGPGTPVPPDHTRSVPPLPTAPGVPGYPLPGRNHPGVPNGPGVPPTSPVNTGRPGRSAIDPGRFGVPGVGKVPAVPRTDTGIIGGTPSTGPGAGAGRGVPRGTVIGGEPQQMGRGMMGMPGAMGTGSPSLGPGGTAKRFASQPGGVVRAPSGSQGAGREFTPGGSGLVRGGSAAGVAGRGAEKERKRPDGPGYLTEDEETWTVGGADNVPPVIE
ncbi:WXG100 family type VII secretion target [Streptomyces sp. I05A-00742]|uniref:WXG100 family type VII secretion target n=1 Tax=Streptomyces sp. I05A-00742 TaxID=2732853 RepID=UPI0014895386|nr:WXG100 family type VII secretion target [Streptomyces sp. I05A-00742]